MKRLDEKRIAELYLSGVSAQTIARHMKAQRCSVTAALKRAGVERDGKWRRGTIERPQSDWLAYRVRYLPKQLEATRRKLAALENEARRYGMHDLVGGGQ